MRYLVLLFVLGCVTQNPCPHWVILNGTLSQRADARAVIKFAGNFSPDNKPLSFYGVVDLAKTPTVPILAFELCRRGWEPDWFIVGRCAETVEYLTTTRTWGR